jgi:hypothetical protein
MNKETPMNHDSKQGMLFKDISDKKLEPDFDGGEISSDAGLLFFRETESRLGIIQRMANATADFSR